MMSIISPSLACTLPCPSLLTISPPSTERTVPIAAREHTVALRYDPLSLRVGL